MIWLHPLAWLGLASLAGPIVIHLLVHRRAPRTPFPTLRFLQPTRLAAMRRQFLDDLPLLIVRLAILAAAAAALAGPLALTAGRRAAYRSRTVRAIVTTDARAATVQREAASAYASTIVEVARPGDGLGAAAAWLRRAPTARREVVIVAPLARGSVRPEELAALPAGFGVRFERLGALPSRAELDGGRTLGPLTSVDRARVVDRSVTLDGDRTRVRELVSGEAALPIQIRASQDATPALNAAVAAVLSQRADAPAADRRAILIVPGRGVDVPPGARIDTPWMADAVAAVAADDELRSTARRIAAAPTSEVPASAPWLPILHATNGRPVVAAAESDRQLVVVSALPAGELATPLLIRSLLDALSLERRSASRLEILPIPDGDLRAWRRDARPPSADEIHRRTSDADDDRRWLWATVLALIAVESWMRRARVQTAADRPAEESRVA